MVRDGWEVGGFDNQEEAEAFMLNYDRDLFLEGGGDANYWMVREASTVLYGGIVAMCFAALEGLLADMVQRAEATTNSSIKEMGRPELPHIDRGVLFLERVCGTPRIFSKNQRRALDTYRRARNQLVHSMAVDLSDEQRNRLADLLPSASSEKLRIDKALAEGAVNAIEDLGASLIDGFVEHFGSGIADINDKPDIRD
jgi:hypothetical protein